MKIESYNEDDHYPLAVNWWIRHNHHVLDRISLPNTGAVALREDGTPVCMAWLFLSNSKVANIGYSVANPECKPKEVAEGLSLVYFELEKVARHLGFIELWTFSSKKGLTKRFKRNGFQSVIPHDFLVKEL